jgi:hypothetical protein
VILHSSDCLFIRVPYAALAKVFGLIEATTKRLEKTALLTAFLLLVIRRSAKGDATSLLQSVYLCINRVSSPQREMTIFNLTLHPAESRLHWHRARDRREPARQGDQRLDRPQRADCQGRAQEGGRSRACRAALEDRTEDAIQAQATHCALRVQSPEGHRDEHRALGPWRLLLE